MRRLLPSFCLSIGLWFGLPASPAMAAEIPVKVGADGTVVIGTKAVSSDTLAAVVSAMQAAQPDAAWAVWAAAGAPPAQVGAVLAVLAGEGVAAVSVRAGAPPTMSLAPPAAPAGEARVLVPAAAPAADKAPSAPAAPPADAPSAPPPPDLSPASAAPPPPIPVAPPPTSLSVRPTGDLRTNLTADDLQNRGAAVGDPTFAFTVPRAAVGANGKLGERLTAKILLEVAEKHATEDYAFTTDGGDTGTIAVQEYPTGWSLRVREGWTDLDVRGDGRFNVRLGSQEPVFGERGTWSDPESPYYRASPGEDALWNAAKLVSSRDLGLRVGARLGQDFGRLDVMVSNGTGYDGDGEDNIGKDVSVRLAVDPVDGLHIVGAALVGARDESGSASMTHLAVGYERAHFGLLASYLGGNTVADKDSEAVRFVGGEGLAWVGTTRSGPLLSGMWLTGRIAQFDPRAETVDADAWMRIDIGPKFQWQTSAPSRFYTLLTWRTDVPMNITLPIEHGVAGQAAWRF